MIIKKQGSVKDRYFQISLFAAFLVFIGTVCIADQSTNSRGGPNALIGEPAAKEIYESCKRAVSANLGDSEFESTLCSANITGAFAGMLSYGLEMASLHPDFNQLPSAHVQTLCLPKKLTVKQAARDYVQWGNENDPERAQFGMAIWSIYRCGPGSNQDKK